MLQPNRGDRRDGGLLIRVDVVFGLFDKDQGGR